jgi:hypothetical protein
MKKVLIGGLILVAGLLLLSAAYVFAQPCEGNFDCDQDVDGTDAAVFKEDFGRSAFKNPCPDCTSICDPPAPVPKTWQWISQGAGDDGDLENGAMWPNPRFTDNNNGTVTDNLTGLIWLKNANCFGQQTWNDALNTCNALTAGYCGLTDGSTAGAWRLPNVKELTSLIHYGFVEPAIPCTAGPCHWEEGDPFTNVQSDYYWSSTTVANIYLAWYVNMGVGDMNHNFFSYSYFVWPVRGGQ